MPTPPTEASLLKFPESWHKPAMPGYGTFPWPHVTPDQDYEEVARGMQTAIEVALNYGYRHIDTAFTYRNQDHVGSAVRAAGISRRDVFVTSKLHQNNNSYIEAGEKIREAIQLIWGNYPSRHSAYLDAFLLHYPGKGQPLEAWRALQEARDQGMVRHIGVSNFEIWHLEKLEKKSAELPEINQIEFHPWIYQEQRELLQYCHEHGIAAEGYSPLAQGIALQDPTLQKIASAHQTTPARVVLKWCMQHGVRPIVGSRNPDHLRMNAEPYGFNLTHAQIQDLNALGMTQPIKISRQWQWDPKTAPFGDASWRRSPHRKLVHIWRMRRA